LFNKRKQKRKQLNTLMEYIINEQIREANDE